MEFLSCINYKVCNTATSYASTAYTNNGWHKDNFQGDNESNVRNGVSCCRPQFPALSIASNGSFNDGMYYPAINYTVCNLGSVYTENNNAITPSGTDIMMNYLFINLNG